MDNKRLGRYDRIYTQLEGLLAKSPNLLAAMATICAVLHHKMKHHSWTGFYLLEGDELYVGPYQGLVACQVLKGQGVCLSCVHEHRAQVVPDVHAFPGHIACDSRTKSEIVLPLVVEDRVVAVLDIDSLEVAAFAKEDIAPLTRILSLLDPFLNEIS